MKGEITERIVEIRCPITGHTEKMGLQFLMVDGKAFDVRHGHCDQHHACEMCELCGKDVRAFFLQDPQWVDLHPYAPLLRKKEEHE